MAYVNPMTMYLPIEAIERLDSADLDGAPGLDYSRFSCASPLPDKATLAARLRRVLSQYPDAPEFSVHMLIDALDTDVSQSALVMFSAAGIFEVPEAASIAGRMIGALGAGLALGRRRLILPRRLLQRKIPRNALAILIQGIVCVMDKASFALRPRWGWVFHPGMSAALGVMLFLLGIVSMAPVIGGGIQHAASAFMIGVGLAERDGLTVMLGAIAGMASIAFAVFSVLNGAKLWSRMKAWAIRCVRRLQLRFLANLLNGVCDGLGDLVRIRWGGLLLLLMTPGEPCEAQRERAGALGGRLKQRAAMTAGRMAYAC
jgi:hypothetical protein